MKHFTVFKRITCTVLAAAVLILPAFAWKVDKQDMTQVEVEVEQGVTIGPSDWAKSEVAKAAEAGLIPQFTGNPSYQDQITREQFAQLAVQLVEVIQKEELPAAPEGTFFDSNSLAIRKASQAGIVTGTGGDKFAPTLTTNREQIATMLYRAVGTIETATGTDLAPKAGSIAGYTDRSSVSLWATEGVGALAANGIMKGTSSVTLSPQDSCSVEQAILLSWRIYSQYGAQAG